MVEAILQTLLDNSRYYSDAYTLYQSAIYAGVHRALADKSQTFAIEADNVELRYYLARLARVSRCFSFPIDALRCAVHLFVLAWNRRQFYKRQFPAYPVHLKGFASLAL
jgi:IS1 family transposase